MEFFPLSGKYFSKPAEKSKHVSASFLGGWDDDDDGDAAEEPLGGLEVRLLQATRSSLNKFRPLVSRLDTWPTNNRRPVIILLTRRAKTQSCVKGDEQLSAIWSRHKVELLFT